VQESIAKLGAQELPRGLGHKPENTGLNADQPANRDTVLASMTRAVRIAYLSWVFAEQNLERSTTDLEA
jgi:hypothetical protein